MVGAETEVFGATRVNQAKPVKEESMASEDQMAKLELRVNRAPPGRMV